jgi:hypothetical protein
VGLPGVPGLDGTTHRAVPRTGLSLSSDRDRVALVVPAAGGDDVRVVDVVTGEVLDTPMAQGTMTGWQSGPALAPDSRVLAFAHRSAPGAAPSLWTDSSLTRSPAEPLPGTSGLDEPAWSHTGDDVVATSRGAVVEGAPWTGLVRVSRWGGPVRRIPGTEGGRDAAVSRTGLVAFERSVAGRGRVEVVPLGGGAPVPWSPAGTDHWADPSWDPQGAVLVAVRDVDGSGAAAPAPVLLRSAGAAPLAWPGGAGTSSPAVLDLDDRPGTVRLVVPPRVGAGASVLRVRVDDPDDAEGAYERWAEDASGRVVARGAGSPAGPWLRPGALRVTPYAVDTHRRRLVGSAVDVRVGDSTHSDAAAEDFDGDGWADLAVFRPRDVTWYVQGMAPVPFGRATDRPVAADYTGDGRAEPALYRASTSEWFVRGLPAVGFGRPRHDVPVPADYDGDGTVDIAVYRPSTSTLYVRGRAPVALPVRTGAVPVAGDWTGDGRAEVALAVTGTGVWWVPGRGTVPLGGARLVPAAHDFDGDGVLDPAGFDPRDTSYRYWASSVPSGQRPQQYVWPAVDPVSCGARPVVGQLRPDVLRDGASEGPGAAFCDGTWFAPHRAPVRYGVRGDVPV